MPSPATLLYALIAITIILVGTIVLRPSLSATRGGKQLAFVILLLLPLTVALLGAEEHMGRSKQTDFCLSCHIMEPYGRSLHIDDPKYVPAAHFQNARVPRDEACYTCHTDYVMYGGIRAKIRGLSHVYVQYLGHAVPPLHLYNPYNNRECLHCHAGARSFEEGTVHNADPAVMSSIKSNQLSCLAGGCHENVHAVARLSEMKFWEPK
jgi:nitrate/TMAO reductase-like tetraheme cytochrome c subunit